MTEQEIQELRDKYERAMATVQILQTKLDDWIQKHKDESAAHEATKVNLAKALADQRAIGEQNQREVIAQQMAYQESQRQLQEKHAADLEALKVDHTGAVQALKDQQAKALAQAKLEHDAAVLALKQQIEVDRLKAQHAAELQALQTRKDEATGA